jgi:hypothetical protein
MVIHCRSAASKGEPSKGEPSKGETSKPGRGKAALTITEQQTVLELFVPTMTENGQLQLSVTALEDAARQHPSAKALWARLIQAQGSTQKAARTIRSSTVALWKKKNLKKAT